MRTVLLLSCLLFAAPPKTLSVLYFENLGKAKQAWLQKGITDMLITELSQVPDLQVVERTRLNAVIGEMQLSQSGLVEEKSAQKAGKLTGAACVVTGSYRIKKEITLWARLIETESGRILKSVSETGHKKQIDSVIHIVGKKIAAHFSKQAPTFSAFTYAQLENHSKGLIALDSNRIEAAAKAFKAVLRENPGFTAAGSNLSLCFKNLKQFRQMRYQREINALLLKIKRTRDFVEAGKYKESLADWMQAFNARFPSPTPAQQQYYKDYMIIRSNCSTPGQGMWHVVMDLNSLGRKYLDSFQDTLAFKQTLHAAVQTGNKAAERFSEDQFTKDIQYFIIVVLNQLAVYFKDRAYWMEIKERGEAFMSAWPDYRMIEAVENFYEKAIKQL